MESGTEAINQLQEVVDGLLNSTKEANSIEKVKAALKHEDTRTFFDNKTRSLLNAGFGSAQEEETRKNATSTRAGIFEGASKAWYLLDSWMNKRNAGRLETQLSD
jgi:hypothetical protein